MNWLRRQLVLARFRSIVWWKMSLLYGHQDAVYGQLFKEAETAQVALEETWIYRKRFNKWWGKFLLR
jgi:hypothetical protein